MTAAPGLYVLGLPFLRHRKSSLIDGAAADAAVLAGHLAGYLDGVNRTAFGMTPDPAALATAVVTRDAAGMDAAISDTVRMRSLLPTGPVDDHGRDAVLARLGDWFADKDAVEIVELRSEQIVDKVLVHHRMTITQGSYRWACTHTLVGKVDDDRLSVIDLLCSGLREF